MNNGEIERFIKHIVKICGTPINTEPIWWPSTLVGYDQFANGGLDSNTMKVIVVSCYKFYNDMLTLYASESLAKFEYNALDIRVTKNNVYGIYERTTRNLLALTTYENLVNLFLKYIFFFSLIS